MYFLSRDTFNYRSLIFISPLFLYSITCIVLILLSSIWWFFLYGPLQQLNEYYEHQNNQLQITIQHMQAKQQHATISHESSCEMLKKQLLHEYQTSAPHDQRILDMFTLLSAAHLFLTGYVPVQERDKQWYSKKSVQYAMQGTFEDFIIFFQQLAQSAMLIQCKHLTIHTGEHDILQVSALFDFIQTKSECCI